MEVSTNNEKQLLSYLSIATDKEVLEQADNSNSTMLEHTSSGEIINTDTTREQHDYQPNRRRNYEWTRRRL